MRRCRLAGATSLTSHCNHQGPLGVPAAPSATDVGTPMPRCRLIPGMTKSGVQKRPEFLNNLLGLPSQE